MNATLASDLSLAPNVVTRINLTSIHEDTVGGVTTGVNVWGYKIPETDTYDLDAYATTDSVGATMQVSAYVTSGGSSYQAAYGAIAANGGGFTSARGSRQNVKLLAGDIVYMTVQQANVAARNLIGGSQFTGLSVKKSSQGGQTIAASDPVLYRYKTAAGQSMAVNLYTLIDFGTKSHASGGEVTTGAAWRLTASAPGLFNVAASAMIIMGGSTNYDVLLTIFKNGVLYSQGERKTGATSTYTTVGASITDDIPLLTDEFLDVRMYQNNGAGTAKPLGADALNVWVNIKRVGNYV